jgi:hypothetical protein
MHQKHKLRRIATVAIMATAAATLTAPIAEAEAPSAAQLVTRAERFAPQVVSLPTASVKVTVAHSTGSLMATNGLHASLTALDGGNSVVRARPGGVQALTVLHRGSTAKFKVDLPVGLKLVKVGRTVEVQDLSGRVTVGTVKAPWAVDARGRQLASSYDVTTNNVIVQRVDTSKATFPVVADPWLTFGWFIYLHLEPWFQKVLLGAGVVGIAGWLGAVICVPTIVGGPAIGICVGAVNAAAYVLWGVIDHYYTGRYITVRFNWLGQWAGWYYG